YFFQSLSYPVCFVAAASLPITSRLYAPGRGFQTSYGFISLNAWFWEIQNPQYAVDATAGV
ncbi:hypothetical protein, partial [Marinilabilia salmonicolor]